MSMEPSSARLGLHPRCHKDDRSIEPRTRFSTWNLVTPANGYPLDSVTLKNVTRAPRIRRRLDLHTLQTGNQYEDYPHQNLLLYI